MTTLSLFSGIGGLDLGLKLAYPWARNTAYVERDPYCQQVLRARMQDGCLDEAPIFDDVTTFDGTRHACDLICGGFPCQDISNAGRREGIKGSRSGLWSEFARIIREVGPRYVFVENVAALLGRGMDVVLGDLSDLGFDAEWGVFSAADVGAPHLRRRIFILAYSQRPGQLPPPDGGRVSGGQWCSLWNELDAGSGTTLADAHSPQRRPDNERGRERPREGSRSDSISLADAEGCCRELRPAERGRPRRPASGDGILGHAQCDSLEGRHGNGANREPASSTGREGLLPVFPPGPADRERWAAVLRDAPHLEPAVCRVAHGFPRRVDRLRCLGNAVVPLVAAYAFRSLAARIAQ